jgi:4-hydroxythreonine-4-phosphate dehydrogenase
MARPVRARFATGACRAAIGHAARARDGEDGVTTQGRRPRIGLVMGDPAGISPELAAKLLAAPGVAGAARLLVIGDRRVLAAGATVAGVALEIDAVRRAENFDPDAARPALLDLGHLDPARIASGEASAAGGAFALANFRRGLELARDGLLDALLFTPFNKQALRLAGNPHADELGFAAELLGDRGPHGEFNVLDRLWNARVTSHVALAEVARRVTREAILDSLALTDRAMRAAGFARPRIAVAALNPHAGEGGAFGREEIDVIAPAVAEARARQIAAEGPFPSNTVFLRARDGKFDAVLTMFHDQGQIAMKLMGFERGVTVLGGLRVPICTPAHGTAYDIAGRGVADPAATLAAFRLARAMGEARAAAA